MKPEQIQRFFSRSCDAREAREVADYLQQHPEIAEQYLSTQEWDEIQDGITMPDSFWENSWKRLRRKKRAVLTRMWAVRTAAAASLAGLLWFGFGLLPKKEAVVSKVVQEQKTEPVIAEEKTIHNTDKEVRTIVLDDHSVVSLYPGSTLRFKSPFQAEARDIRLIGTAGFKVARDMHRPFTVYSGALSTTALGTEFKVAEKGMITTVQLYHGKVVVRATERASGWKGDVFLMAGQQVKYNQANGKQWTMAIPGEQVKKSDVAANTTRAESALVFHNTPLAEVFEKIGKYYHVSIRVDAAAITGKNFTGDLEGAEAVEVVLQVIARMNDLDLVTTQDGFEIKAVDSTKE